MLEDQEVHGRYLGPSRAVGNMTFKVLNDKGNTLHRSSFRPLTREEEDNPEEREKRKVFDARVGECLGSNMKPEDNY
jgi:hypothetical protein